MEQAGEGQQLPTGGQCSCTRPCESHLWPLISVPWQIQPRRYQRKLPLQANFYPMPAMAYIQDMQSRLTLLTAQALGVSSLHSGELGSVPWGPAVELGLSSPREAGEEVAAGWAGCPGPAVSGGPEMWDVAGTWKSLGCKGSLSTGQLEVILDRRLMQDDNRGLGQGLKDNKLTCNRFRLLLERRSTANKVLAVGQQDGRAQPCLGMEQGGGVCRKPHMMGCSVLSPLIPLCWHWAGMGLEQGAWGEQDMQWGLSLWSHVTLIITVFLSHPLAALCVCCATHSELRLLFQTGLHV